jgi:hypothetical protein
MKETCCGVWQALAHDGERSGEEEEHDLVVANSGLLGESGWVLGGVTMVQSLARNRSKL